MSTEITDRQLERLIQGELSDVEERQLENLLSLDAELRARLDRICGGDQWSIGSAPMPDPHHSMRLSLAMEQVGRYVHDGAGPDMYTPHDLPKLPTLSGITLVRQIGQGGMGVVYEGLDDALGRRVAVKFIQPMRAASPEARERLVREAKAAAALHHDNIVTVHSIQTIEGMPALIQQYIDGPTLQEVIDSSGALPIERCIDLARQLARGLVAAHAAGIVHRDLKPGNVLIETQTGKARLADFGMAQHVAGVEPGSPDVISGTPAYMSPEQTRGEPTDGRSDLFSLGAILYTVIAGQTPFRGDDPFAVMEQVRNSEPTPLAKLRTDSPVWLNKIVSDLLAKDPGARIESADKLLQLLDISSILEAGARPRRKLAIVAVCLLVSAMLLAWWRPKKPLQTQPPGPSVEAAVETSPLVWIGEPTRAYPTLAAAVKDAADGDEIILARNVASEQIDIVGKRLTISAAPGTQPLITPTEWAIENSPFLFRANRDLTIKGLHIDWPVKTEPLTEPGVTLSAVVAVSQNDATLRVEDCTVSREGGICVASAGNLTVIRSRIRGGLFALGWVANNTRVDVSESQLECDSSLVVLHPQANVASRKSSTVHFDHSSFTGLGVVDFILFRHPDMPIEITADNCTFDVDRLLQLSGTTIVANLSWDWVAQSVAKSCVHWQENNCQHRPGIEYVASRRIRGANRWMMNNIKGLAAWEKFWNQKEEEVPHVRDAREMEANQTKN